MMKLRYFLLLIIFVVVYCPAKYKPSAKKIDICYLASVYEDIFRDEPLMAGIQCDTGFIIGHLMPEYPVMTVVLGELGIYDLLDSAGIDFIISDSALFMPQNSRCYIIPISSGYAIMNYGGVRFAMLAHERDSLDIDDEVTRAIVEQRSDILWMIDRSFLDTPPRHIQFYIENRGLADTSMTSLTPAPDTGIIALVREFRGSVERTLATPVALPGTSLKEFVLSRVAGAANTDLLLYPASLFRDTVSLDTITLRDMIENIAFETKYKRSSRMTRTDVQDLVVSHDYHVWGTVQDTNAVLHPDRHGIFLYTYYFPMDLSGN